MNGRPPKLMAISDRHLLGDESLIDWCVRLGEAGVDAIQLREKDLSDLAVFDLARRIRQRLPRQTRLLINGRIDLAVAAGADGVHLPVVGLPIAPLRARLGRGRLIGRSTHSPAEVMAARHEGADYVLFGPVYPTPSKARYGPPPGVEGLRAAVSHGLPVLALGGVTIERLAEIAEAGAHGVAGIRVFQERRSLEQLLTEARRWFTHP